MNPWKYRQLLQHISISPSASTCTMLLLRWLSFLELSLIIPMQPSKISLSDELLSVHLQTDSTNSPVHAPRLPKQQVPPSTWRQEKVLFPSYLLTTVSVDHADEVEGSSFRGLYPDAFCQDPSKWAMLLCASNPLLRFSLSPPLGNAGWALGNVPLGNVSPGTCV